MSEPWMEGDSTEHEQLQKIRSLLTSSLMRVNPGQKITKLGFWEDSNGNLKYIKAYDGETLLFTLTFNNAGEATQETWNIARS
jgi:hypothetical protein